jgi:hypothetical protein
MLKYANLMLKPSRVPGGVVLLGDDPLRGPRIFFVNEKGVHECDRDGKKTLEQLATTGVLIDCNPAILSKALALLELEGATESVKP